MRGRPGRPNKSPLRGPHRRARPKWPNLNLISPRSGHTKGVRPEGRPADAWGIQLGSKGAAPVLGTQWNSFRTQWNSSVSAGGTDRESGGTGVPARVGPGAISRLKVHEVRRTTYQRGVAPELRTQRSSFVSAGGTNRGSGGTGVPARGVPGQRMQRSSFGSAGGTYLISEGTGVPARGDPGIK